jgi:hypothetical protein
LRTMSSMSLEFGTLGISFQVNCILLSCVERLVEPSLDQNSPIKNKWVSRSMPFTAV